MMLMNKCPRDKVKDACILFAEGLCDHSCMYYRDLNPEWEETVNNVNNRFNAMDTTVLKSIFQYFRNQDKNRKTSK